MHAIDLSLAEKTHKLYAHLSELGIPGNKTEHYRNFAIKPILLKEYHLPQFEKTQAQEGEKLIIKNGKVIAYPKGISLRMQSDFDADNAHYDALYYMSHIVAPEVISIELNGEANFEIEHICDEPERFFTYRLHVKTAPNTHVEVFETFQMQGSQESLLIYGVDAEITADSTLHWIRDEYAGKEEAVVVGSHYCDVQRQGVFDLKSFDFGSGQALHIYKIDLGDYAWSNAEHLLLASAKAHRGNVVTVNHNRPYAKSAQEARSILKDTATGIFDAKIHVAHDARYSDAKQNSKAILLSDHAHMYAKPQLEIYTDELEASHGSTIGQLEEDMLFYLRSRGITNEEARKMLILAFADTLIESVSNTKALEKIHQDFEHAYKN